MIITKELITAEFFPIPTELDIDLYICSFVRFLLAPFWVLFSFQQWSNCPSNPVVLKQNQY